MITKTCSVVILNFGVTFFFYISENLFVLSINTLSALKTYIFILFEFDCFVSTYFILLIINTKSLKLHLSDTKRLALVQKSDKMLLIGISKRTYVLSS